MIILMVLDPKSAEEAKKADERPPGADQVEVAGCGHMVQSNGTCGMYGCPRYGQP